MMGKVWGGEGGVVEGVKGMWVVVRPVAVSRG